MFFLFCTSSFIMDGGGIASYAHDFIQAFKTDNVFTVVTSDDYVQSDNQTVVQIKSDDFCLVNAMKLLSVIDEVKPDIIINSNFALLTLVTPFIDNNIKIITVSHFVNGKQAWNAGMCGNYVDNIISLSTFGKKYINNRFHIKDEWKTVVVYNYMNNLSKVDLLQKKCRRILRIVYPGGCSYMKSAEIVCKSLKQLLKTNLKFEFYWLGNTKIPGDKWPYNKVKKVEDCLNASDPRVVKIGKVSRAEAQLIIADANIFLLPSRGEGCPISLLEAMRAGCIPIISDAKHGSFDLIKDQMTGLVVRQGSADEITNSVISIINNHDKYFNIYDNTLKEFQSNLNYSSWYDKMNKIIHGLNRHQERIQFSKTVYYRYRFVMMLLLLFDWTRDRFARQMYHVLYYQYLKYIY